MGSYDRYGQEILMLNGSVCSDGQE